MCFQSCSWRILKEMSEVYNNKKLDFVWPVHYNCQKQKSRRRKKTFLFYFIFHQKPFSILSKYNAFTAIRYDFSFELYLSALSFPPEQEFFSRFFFDVFIVCVSNVFCEERAQAAWQKVHFLSGQQKDVRRSLQSHVWREKRLQNTFLSYKIVPKNIPATAQTYFLVPFM